MKSEFGNELVLVTFDLNYTAPGAETPMYWAGDSHKITRPAFCVLSGAGYCHESWMDHKDVEKSESVIP